METRRNLWFFSLCFSAVIGLGGPNMILTQPRFVRANQNGEASFVCGFNSTEIGEEFQVIVHKGHIIKNTEVCSASFTNHTMKPLEKKSLLHCLVWPSKENVSITIWGLNVTDTDLYICRISRMHPPPYKESTGRGTVIYVNRAASYSRDQEADAGFLLTAVLTVLATLLFLYSISITVVYCKHKMKDDTIYINVRK
ncbi:cytotoxic T-lymphocyte protein 4-like [Heptranchias perlo]|uniref:cytotoxic T-lymphocyte protein 4-like n=1 Tax=Heptranchias perlo TaxID=212740 RepID=UPI00355A2552